MKIVMWLITGSIGLVVVVLLLIYFLPGYDIRTVRSDSMKPSFSAGDMIVTVPPASLLAGEIQEDSIVTYNLNGQTITHRVVSVRDGILITKGDANEESDARPVETSQVKGMYLLRIPKVGYVDAFMHSRSGRFLAFALPGVGLLGLMVKKIIRGGLDPGRQSEPG